MKTRGGKVVKNAEIIEECIGLMRGRNIGFMKVKSHLKVWYNELADRKAAEGVRKDEELNSSLWKIICNVGKKEREILL